VTDPADLHSDAATAIDIKASTRSGSTTKQLVTSSRSMQSELSSGRGETPLELCLSHSQLTMAVFKIATFNLHGLDRVSKWRGILWWPWHWRFIHTRIVVKSRSYAQTVLYQQQLYGVTLIIMINYTLRYIVLQMFFFILATIYVIYIFIYGQSGYTHVLGKLNLKRNK